MRNLLLLIVLLTTSSLSIAATTLTWIGKVPSISCADNPVSNKIELKELQNQCHNDIMIDKNTNKENKAIAAFNL
ncbi:hypothetical protein [Aliivibrio logei]|uniref:Uncharacterized protein n=1 Tax=Aliivibrio logei 5S-186 TaxID=626086 RepID=A0ABX3B1Z5_ALILO|nr:hypothetical protein [Aliivibrio logei]OEF22520.1 hypothetical protein A1Q5_15705 [Aliivibrio logei 5S-186]